MGGFFSSGLLFECTPSAYEIVAALGPLASLWPIGVRRVESHEVSSLLRPYLSVPMVFYHRAGLRGRCFSSSSSDAARLLPAPAALPPLRRHYTAPSSCSSFPSPYLPSGGHSTPLSPLCSVLSASPARWTPPGWLAEHHSPNLSRTRTRHHDCTITSDGTCAGRRTSHDSCRKEGRLFLSALLANAAAYSRSSRRACSLATSRLPRR